MSVFLYFPDAWFIIVENHFFVCTFVIRFWIWQKRKKDVYILFQKAKLKNCRKFATKTTRLTLHMNWY